VRISRGFSYMRWELWRDRGYHGRIIVLLGQRIACFLFVEHCYLGSRGLSLQRVFFIINKYSRSICNSRFVFNFLLLLFLVCNKLVLSAGLVERNCKVQTIKLRGRELGVRILLLEDSGSTQNFISKKLVSACG